MNKKSTAAKDLLPGGITKEQLQAWKRDYPEGVNVLEVQIEPKEEGKDPEKATIYVMDPFNKPEIVTEAMGKESKFEQMDYLFARCFLGGDKEVVFGSKKAKFAAALENFSLVEIYEASIKKA